MARFTAIDATERFWSKVDKSGDCWLWLATTSGQGGYGHFHVSGGAKDRVREYAHRWSYEQAKGPIPEGMELDHLCRNRKCVNPDHLEPVAHAVNHERRRGIPHGPRDLGPFCRNGHERTPENTAVNKQGYKFCRLCANESQRRYKARQQSQ